MTCMHQKRCALLLALLLSFACVFACAEGSLMAQDAQLQSAALTLQYSGAASLQWALFSGEECLSSGSLNTDGTSDQAQLYGVGSVSKIYTTAAVMKLVEQGRLSLDEPVVSYLPDFVMADERYRQITVRMLLNHSSGLMFAGMQDAFLFDSTDNTTAVDSLLAELSTQRLIADPGAYSVYCNTGFTLAQVLVERVSGMPLGDFLRESFLEPMDLSDTFACQDAFDRDRLAPAYLALDPTRPVADDSVTVTGTGGIYATAKDLARFGGMLAGQDDLLSDESLLAMAADEYARGLWPAQSEGDALAYGLGWDCVHMLPFSLSDIQALCKGGDTNLYHAALVVLPEYGLSAAVLSSGGLSTYNQLLAARLLIDVLAEQGVTVAEEAALPQAQPAPMLQELTALSGIYASFAGTADVRVTEDGTLTLTQGEGDAAFTQTFVYCDDGFFRDATGAIRVALITEDNGKTYFFQQAYSPIPGLTLLGTANYALQRLDPLPEPDDSVAAIWRARENKQYFMLNAHYNSQAYALTLPCTAVVFDNALPGYLATSRIEDEEWVRAVLQLPGTGGRDSMDVRCFKEDGVEYLSAAGYLYIEESALGTLSAAQSIAIGEEGYAQWFHLDPALVGKRLSVVLPEHGSFSVYDVSGTPLACSAAYGDTSVLLPEEGYAVFAGDPGVRFEVDVTE